MIKLKLPIWADKGTLNQLKNLAFDWFSLVKTWLNVAFYQHDPLTCPMLILNLLAYERGIDRFKNEPESLYRKRVKFAFINAKEAGTKDGLKNIFNRLGLGEIKILERNPFYDWDVITIQISDEQIKGNEELLRLILKKYGRTCRRYQFEAVSIIPVNVAAGSFTYA